MSRYTILATASIILALLALALAVATVLLVCVKRRPWADRALSVLLAVLAVGATCAFFAGVEGQNDLQVQSRRVASLAASAEQRAHSRFGRYTTSVAQLRRLSPALATQLRVNGAAVAMSRSRVTDTVRIHAWLGYGTSARLTLHHHPRDHLSGLAGPRAVVRRFSGDLDM
ncbi:MAG: hypothetical protein ACXVSE_15020 [Solirubrobacteraceae bacterium]